MYGTTIAASSGSVPRRMMGVMMRRRWSIGNLLGIPIEVDLSWALIFLVLTSGLASGFVTRYFPFFNDRWKWIIAAFVVVVLFTCILLHELAHCWVARRYNLPVEGITLFVFGGVARLTGEPDSPAVELKMAVAGPAMSFLLAMGCGALAWSIDMFPFLGQSEEIFRYLADMNLMLAAFNLLPGFPMDGGRVLRACIWRLSGNPLKATRIASAFGQAVGLSIIAFGAWMAYHGGMGSIVQGLWLAVLGWFLTDAARFSYEQSVVRGALAGVSVSSLMSSDIETVSGEITLKELVDDFFLTHPRTGFPVTENQEVKGKVTLARVKRVPRERWHTAHVNDIIEPLDEDEWVNPEEDVWVTLRENFRNGADRLLVIDNGILVGAIGRDELVHYMKIKTELGL